MDWSKEKNENEIIETALSIFFSDDKDTFYVFFTESGTLILTPLEVAKRGFDVSDSNSLRFFYESTSMTFLFSYLDHKENLREIWESDGEKNFELGEPLSFENEYPNTSGLISRVMKELIGISFDYIDPQEAVYKCTKLPSEKSIPGNPMSNIKKDGGKFGNEYAIEQ